MMPSQYCVREAVLSAIIFRLSWSSERSYRSAYCEKCSVRTHFVPVLKKGCQPIAVFSAIITARCPVFPLSHPPPNPWDRSRSALIYTRYWFTQNKTCNMRCAVFSNLWLIFWVRYRMMWTYKTISADSSISSCQSHTPFFFTVLETPHI